MKIGIFSDLQLHNHGPYSRPHLEGVNTRGENCLNILEQVRDVAESESLGAVLFCGDFWDLRGYLWVPLFNQAYALVSSIAEVCPFVLISGNHDLSANNMEAWSSVEVFNDIQDVHHLRHRFNTKRLGDGVLVVGMSAFEEFPPLPIAVLDDIQTRILLIHETIVGAKITNQFNAESGMNLDNLKKHMKDNKIDQCFAGDIHLRQELAPNIRYVGACIQKSFSDAPQKKGMLIYDTETNKVTFRGLKSPRFLTDDGTGTITDFDYWRIETETIDDYHVAKERLKDGLATNIQLIPPEKKQVKRSSISLTTSHADALREYVGIHADKKDAARLLKQGDEFLIGGQV